jgi:hypothetical protein
MLHISDTAIDYIREAFRSCYFDSDTTNLWREVSGISKAMSHRIRTDNSHQIRKFAENILSRIDQIIQKNPFVNLEEEREYFSGFLESK